MLSIIIQRSDIVAFQSLSKLASKYGKGGQTSYVSALQSKKSSGSTELTFRLSAIAMEKIGVRLGDKVDVLRDAENDLWMIKKMPDGNGGMTLSGQKNKAGVVSTASVRMILREGMPRLSNEEDTVKQFSIDEDAMFSEESIVFTLK